ncbi:DUF1697 domain-containing protein [Gordonia sp. FQ]|uniref:DUF1697 domain-containing protein n=1 Tax=Gordonia sp. FQ TaxID=3446634 RepID=UPI003F870B19
MSDDEPRVYLFRAVNVGGAKLPMARLREIATELGATAVSTYIASGNLICVPPALRRAAQRPDDNAPGPEDGTQRAAEGFERALERAVEEEFGFFREVISRSADQLEKALAAYPFGTPPDYPEAPSAHICFLAGTPDPARAAEFVARDFGAGELLAVIGDDLHLAYPGGAGKTKLTPPAIAKGLGYPGTARNLRTVAKLIDLATAASTTQ